MTAQLTLQSERRSFESAVLPLQRALRSAALRMSRSAADADDLVQETVLRAWRFWPRYHERATCRAWLHRILRNTFLTRCRQRTRERDVLCLAHTLSDPHEGLFATRLATDHERDSLDDTLSQGLRSLRAEQRQVLELVDVERRSYKEAAAALGVPIGTVMSRLHRARHALRERLVPDTLSCHAA